MNINKQQTRNILIITLQEYEQLWVFLHSDFYYGTKM